MIQKLGKYQITEKLGEGAMGAVYKAYDEMLDRYVAVKTMASDIKWDPELKLRFYREARSAASLHHPNIVTIHDLGEDGKITFIVMELLQGQDLKNVIREKAPLALEQKLSIMAQVSDGLSHAHLNGIIHRDVKPGNIHVTPAGTVKILDFGIARIPSSDLTRSGVRLGTPVYMSPEQIRGVEYDERSDIFSAGIVFYELLTYVHPFRDKNIVKTMDNILFQTHFPFAEQIPDAPSSLWPIVNGCLAKEPDKRYGSMAEVSRTCRRLMDDLKISCQKMTAELERLLPRLRAAAGQTGAPARLVQIYQEAASLLGQEEKPDYLTLQRLLSSLPREGQTEPPIPSQSRGTEESGAPTGPARAAEEGIQRSQAVKAPGTTSMTPLRDVPPSQLPSTEPPAKSGIHAAETFKAPVAAEPSGPTPEEIQGTRLMQEGEALLKQDRCEEAVERLRQAVGLLGPNEELVRLLADARRRTEEQKRARAADFLKNAGEALASREFARAVEALDEVLQIEPDRREAIEMRRQARAELDAEKARQARKAEGEREKLLGFKLLSENKFRESLRALKHAKELLGEDSAIQLGMEEAEEGVRREDLQARIQSELAEATALFRAQVFDKARAQANRVLELSPKNAGAVDLLQRLETAEQEKQLRDRISELCQKSREALDRKAYDEAALLANEAAGLNPANGQAAELLRRIEQAKEEDRRHQQVQALVSQAREAEEKQDFDTSISLLEDALQLNPQDAQVRGFLDQAKKAREDFRKERETAEAVAEARQAFLRGELDRCEELVRRALGNNPQHVAARDLLDRLNQSRETRRKDQISTYLAQGRRALEGGDFDEARSQAQRALQLDSECGEAGNLIQEVFRAETEHRQNEIRSLLSKSSSALDGKAFDDAVDLAGQVLKLDDKNKEAKSLVKTIEKARRAHEKELKKKKPMERPPETAHVPDLGKPAGGEETWVMGKPEGKQGRKTPLWIGGGLLVVIAAAVVTFFMMRVPRTKTVDVSANLAAQVSAAKENLQQKMYDRAIEISRQILAMSPTNAEAPAIIAQAESQRKQATIETLMMEAQNLRGQKQLDNANQTLQKILDLEPGYAPALEVKSQIEAEISSTKSQDEQNNSIQRWLANAGSLLAAGKVAEAKAEMDKVVRLRPNAPELGPLRKNLASQSAELARSQKEQQEAAQKQARITELRRKVSDLFSQGKYAESQSALDQMLAEDPQNAQGHTLRSQIADALSSIKAYENAMAEKRYEEALSAATRLQKINPSDPNVSSYKKHVEERKSSATATFAIFRLGESGNLTLDDQPVGANGEVEGKSVPIGHHRLAVKNSQGKQSTLNIEFSDGQKAEYVYDSSIPELRPFAAGDRALLDRRKAREEMREYQVEHNHGTFRGKCKGVLSISGVSVDYKTSETDHSFSAPFRNVKLIVRDDRAEFTISPDNKKENFKLADSAKAKDLQQLWNRLLQLLK